MAPKSAMKVVKPMKAMKTTKKGGICKKPALSDMVKDLGEKEEEEAKDSEAVVVRDKQKAVKFKKMMESGQLPPSVLYMYEHESKAAPQGRRSFQSSIINKLFTKQSDGSFRVNSDSGEFSQWNKLYERHTSKDKTKALPWGVMLYTHFGGNENAMKESLNKGELQRMDDEKGMSYLSFRELSTVKANINETGESTTGIKSITAGDRHELVECMKRLKWNLHPAKATL